MMPPSVSIGLRSGRVFIISTYSPGPGTYVQKAPVFESSSSDTEAIGFNVARGLDEFVSGGEIPDWAVYRSPVLGVAGVRTWHEYERGLKSCVLDQHEDEFIIRGDRPAIAIRRTATVNELGDAVLHALGTTKEQERKKTSGNDHGFDQGR